jgi:hypothetical protein
LVLHKEELLLDIFTILAGSMLGRNEEGIYKIIEFKRSKEYYTEIIHALGDDLEDSESIEETESSEEIYVPDSFKHAINKYVKRASYFEVNKFYNQFNKEYVDKKVPLNIFKEYMSIMGWKLVEFKKDKFKFKKI